MKVFEILPIKKKQVLNLMAYETDVEDPDMPSCREISMMKVNNQNIYSLDSEGMLCKHTLRKAVDPHETLTSSRDENLLKWELELIQHV
jgi:hypothetical protein